MTGDASSPDAAKLLNQTAWRTSRDCNREPLGIVQSTPLINIGKPRVLRKDGDLCLTTDNSVLLRNTKKELPINCAQKKSSKKLVEDIDLVRSNLSTFGNDIGPITNRATSMYEVRARYIKGSDEYNILSYRIMCCQLMQQNEIDRCGRLGG